MARGVKGPTSVQTGSRPSFVMGSRPPDLYAPRIAPRPQGNITAAPRIKPMTGQTQYGKAQNKGVQFGGGFGDTGLTGES